MLGNDDGDQILYFGTYSGINIDPSGNGKVDAGTVNLTFLDGKSTPSTGSLTISGIGTKQKIAVTVKEKSVNWAISPLIVVKKGTAVDTTFENATAITNDKLLLDIGEGDTTALFLVVQVCGEDVAAKDATATSAGITYKIERPGKDADGNATSTPVSDGAVTVGDTDADGNVTNKNKIIFTKAKIGSGEKFEITATFKMNSSVERGESKTITVTTSGGTKR